MIDIKKESNNLLIKNDKFDGVFDATYDVVINKDENLDYFLKIKGKDYNNDSIIYNIPDNYISLEDFFKDFNKMSEVDYINMVKCIDSALNESENYLLSENNITLDFNAIFINKDTKDFSDLKFVYVPSLNLDFSYELSKHLIRVLRFADVGNKNALDLGYALFVKTSIDNYTINDLLKVCDDFIDIQNKEKVDNLKNKVSDSTDNKNEYMESMANKMLKDSIKEL